MPSLTVKESKETTLIYKGRPIRMIALQSDTAINRDQQKELIERLLADSGINDNNHEVQIASRYYRWVRGKWSKPSDVDVMNIDNFYLTEELVDNPEFNKANDFTIYIRNI